MPDIKQERKYRAIDVRRCFPLASDPVITRWIERGFISHGRGNRGLLPIYTFNFAELCHIGIVLEMSALGITRAPEQVGIMYQPVDIYKEEAATLSLKDASQLVEIYVQNQYDLCFLFWSVAELSDFTKSRYKKGSRLYFGNLRPTQTISEIIGEAMRDPHFWHLDHGFVLIHVGAVANKVSKALGLGEIWQRRIPKF